MKFYVPPRYGIYVSTGGDCAAYFVPYPHRDIAAWDVESEDDIRPPYMATLYKPCDVPGLWESVPPTSKEIADRTCWMVASRQALELPQDQGRKRIRTQT